MLNVIRRIQKANQGRDPEHLALKYQALRGSPFVFLRGTCSLFYDRLPKDRALRSAPLAWSCGDLHLANFGSYKGDNRLVYFDINDFDEALLAPASWDLLRLLTSVLVSTDDAQDLCRSLLNAYAETIKQGKARWLERETAQGLVGDLLNDLRTRSRAQFLDQRTVLHGQHRRLLIDGKKTSEVSDKQRAKVMKFMAAFAKRQAHPDFYQVLDVAQRLAGTGSLGVERYVILVEGKGSPQGNYLLDLKEARPSSVAPHVKAAQPPWATEAQRVVTLQRRLQAVSVAFLHAVTIGRKSYVLRGLQASQDRVDLSHGRCTQEQRQDLMSTLGELVAWAQLRSSGRQGSATADQLIEFVSRKKWKSSLLSAADAAAQQVRADWATYCKGYDAGLVSPTGR